MDSFVEMTGEGSVTLTPDVAALNLRLEHQAETAADALAATSTAAQHLVDALTAAGVAETDRQTSGIGLHRGWDQARSVESGYVASQGLRVVVRDIAGTGALLAAAAEAAGDTLRIDGLTWSLADFAGPLAQAREAAWRDAADKARHCAALAGVTLGPVQAISEDVDAPGAVSRGAKALALDSAPISPGEGDVQVRLRVRWSVADGSAPLRRDDQQ